MPCNGVLDTMTRIPLLPQRRFFGDASVALRARSRQAAASRWLATALVLLLVCGCNTDSGTKISKPRPPVKPAPKGLADEVESPLLLTTVTERTGIRFEYRNGRESDHNVILESLGGGGGAFDFDGDGLLDLVFAGGGKYGPEKEILGLPTGLFRNLGDWKFQDVSQWSGISEAPYYTHGVSAGDFNNDGFQDLVVSGYGGLVLWQNQGDGTFLSVQEQAGMLDNSWSTSIAWGDLNGDGNLDLYVPHYVNWSFRNDPFCGSGPTPGSREICSPRKFDPLPDMVYYSNGDGTFHDATTEVGLRPDGKGLGCMLGDVDCDGDLDIYVANDTVDNFLYLNNGHGLFEEVALLNGVAADAVGGADGSMGVDLGDYNLDGLPDLWVANFEEEAFALYRNDGGAQFIHVSQATGVTSLGGLYVGFGTVYADIDRDGDEDLLVSNGHVINYPKVAPVRQQPLLLVNRLDRGENRFFKAKFPKGTYFYAVHRGRGLIAADMDDDGDQDFVFTHNDDEPAAVLRNDTTDKNSWLRVRLIGRRSNRDAIGARLVLTTTKGKKTRHQMRQVKGGCSYLCQNDLRQLWGVPQGEEIRKLAIYWPGSTTPSEITDLEANRGYTFYEPLDAMQTAKSP